MALADDLERIAAAAAALAGDGDSVAGVLAAEPAPGARAYLCAFRSADGHRTWLALDDAGRPLAGRQELRELVSMTAVCELAVEFAFPGDLDELRAELVALRLTEGPEGVDEAAAAAAALQHALGAPPQLATPSRLDEVGSAARRLELALDPAAPSLFAAAMKATRPVIAELQREVEGAYRVPLGRGLDGPVRAGD